MHGLTKEQIKHKLNVNTDLFYFLLQGGGQQTLYDTQPTTETIEGTAARMTLGFLPIFKCSKIAEFWHVNFLYMRNIVTKFFRWFALHFEEIKYAIN